MYVYQLSVPGSLESTTVVYFGYLLQPKQISIEGELERGDDRW